MSKKVTLFINEFAPGSEGVSNELYLLYSQLARDPDLKILLHNISSSPTFRVSTSYISYPFFLLPMCILITKYIEHKSNLLHIFGSLTGRLYLKLLKKRPILLTNSSAIQESRVEQCSKDWNKLDKVVVECRRDETRLLEYGLHRDKVCLIYPGVDTSAFSYHPPPSRFTVGFASDPISNDPQAIKKRGVNLLFHAARELPDIHFVLLCRQKHYAVINQLHNAPIRSNISLINRIYPDMNLFYRDVHCTILPSTIIDDSKPCPNSLIESLSAGKPILASRHIGISDIISESSCGLVFEPHLDDLLAQIAKLRDNYSIYQSHARTIAQQYFSAQRFINDYKLLYNKLLST